MQNVTDRTSNPFGMSPPCPHACSEGVPAVFGYGDANADVHVVGDHPGVHGGRTTGVPFSGTDPGLALQSVLEAVDLLSDPGAEPTLHDTFLSYLHMCCPPEGADPSPDDYADLERFFDSELRAIAAHVLVPVGERATRHVLEQYTARARRYVVDPDDTASTRAVGDADGTAAASTDGAGTVAASDASHRAEASDAIDASDGEATPGRAATVDMDALHATEVKGSGWLVLPLRDPAEWTEADREAAVEALAALLDRDYRQITDLGRFLATDEPYYVR